MKGSDQGRLLHQSSVIRSVLSLQINFHTHYQSHAGLFDPKKPPDPEGPPLPNVTIMRFSKSWVVIFADFLERVFGLASNKIEHAHVW